MLKQLQIITLLLVYKSLALQGTFEDRFQYHETLHHNDILHHAVKRDADSVRNEKVISLSTLGKHFKLHLQPQRGLFTEDFQAVLIDAVGASHKIDVDTTAFYEGYVEGDNSSHVNAYWQGHDLSAMIKTSADIFVIEPSQRLLPSSKAYSMVSYRLSDMRQKTLNDLGKSYCGYVHPDGTDDANADNYLTIKSTDRVPPIRNKRQSTTRTRCTVALVADYHFYQDIGSSSESQTINYMVQSLTYAHNIFIATNFGTTIGTGFGFQIKQVKVNTVPTGVTTNSVHYNMARSGSQWDVSQLLTAFSSEDWSGVCLSHLYTSQAFNNGVLGLGWIAAASSGTTGGICSTLTGGKYYNTAFSSSKNSGGSRLTTLEANIVTTHEFGHNWGSPHDPASCAPSSSSGGKYIMYQYSVNGYDTNNEKFSTCSSDTMGSVLVSKKDRCFTDPAAAICGNGIVESNNGEECDAGSVGLAGNDLCCSSACQLNANYVCSDRNDVCCNQCQYASSTTQCGFTGSLTSSCLADVNCPGDSASCPTAPFKADNTTCGNRGECQNGVCLSYCEVRNLLDCECTNIDLACKQCCKDGASGTCDATPPGAYVDQADGRPCIIGYCESGVCVQQVTVLTQRTWDVISNLTANNLLEFMKSNIVLTVVVITLVIYIPFVIVILIIDWKNEEKDEDEREWLNRENDRLVREDSDVMIRPTYTRRRAQASRTNRYRREDTASDGGRASSSGVHVANM